MAGDSLRQALFTAAFDTELAKTAISLELLIEIQLADDSFLRMSTGIGTVVWDSRTWLGTGLALGIEGYREDANGSANGLRISLTGTESTIISIALQSLERSKPVKVYIALLDSANVIIDDPYLLFLGKVDETNALYSDGNASIVLNAETDMLNSRRSSNRMLSHLDQIIAFPDDLGLQYITRLKAYKGQWGSTAVITATAQQKNLDLSSRFNDRTGDIGGGETGEVGF